MPRGLIVIQMSAFCLSSQSVLKQFIISKALLDVHNSDRLHSYSATFLAISSASVRSIIYSCLPISGGADDDRRPPPTGLPLARVRLPASRSLVGNVRIIKYDQTWRTLESRPEDYDDQCKTK